MPDRPYTDADIDSAIEAIADPQRMRDAQDLVMHAAPALLQILAAAITDGGWFDPAHEQAAREATSSEDPAERLRLIRTLLAEETRMGMLVGVAVGFELAKELNANTTQED